MYSEDSAAGLPPPPPEFGTVIRLDAPRPAIVPPPSERATMLAVVAVAAGISGLGAIATWFVLSAQSERPSAPEVAATVAAAVAAPAAPERVAVAAPSPTPCPDGMVEIAGGSYFMGSDDVDQPTLQPARPAHKVEVGSYCIDVNEVTVADYRACSDTGECKRAHRDAMWPRGDQDDDAWAADRNTYIALCNEGVDGRDDHPANCVSWHQAVAYCAWKGGRLQTEEEWEYAARGSDGRVYSWGDEIPDSERMNGCGTECVAWRAAVELASHPPLYETDDGFIGTAPVGSFPAGKTQAGLFDMAGNVFEWTQSEFLPFDEAERLAQAAKADTKTPTKRVIRGGAFNSFMPAFADPALRFGQVEDAHPHAIGFRCAANPTP